MSRMCRITLFVFIVFAFVAGPTPTLAAEHWLGGGVRFFSTLDEVEIDDLGKIDADGSSTVLSYLADPAGPLKIEFDIEYFKDGYDVQTGEIVSPQLLFLVGGKLYGGVGAGINYIQDNLIGDDTSDVFYIGRLGLLLTLVPRFQIDINANYQTDVFDKVFSGASSRSITLGVMGRFRLK